MATKQELSDAQKASLAEGKKAQDAVNDNNTKGINNAIQGGTGLSKDRIAKLVGENAGGGNFTNANRPGLTDEERANEALTGFQSPLSLNDIRNREAESNRQIAQQANVLFDPAISRAEDTGRTQISNTEGVIGSSQGFNLSTAESQFLQQVQGQVDDRISEIEKAKAQFISEGNFRASDRADKALERLQDANNELLFKRIETIRGFGADRRAQEGLDFEKSQALKEDEIDPFFKGSDIINAMKALAPGETTSITDPSTGTVFQIQGIGEPTANTKTVQSTDDQGNTTVTTIDLTKTGPEAIISQTILKGVGKSKTAPVSITLNAQQAGLLGDSAVALNASKGSDGFINTDAFMQQRQNFVASGGDVKVFDNNFKQQLNPNDPTAKRFLTKSEIDVATGGEGITPENETFLLGAGVSQELIDQAKAAGLSMEDLL